MNGKDYIFGTPIISPKAFVFNDESVIGDVVIEHDVIVAPGASIRADECGPFYIGKGTNVQDGVIFHGLLNKYIEVGEEQFSIWIGSHCSIAHRALIHGPSMIGKKTFIGFDAIVHASVIGRNCFIDFKAVVKK
jgi:carbonic anhydrase/acetyltransferase-like protein (isoleucine patch superfamily)